MNSIEQFDQEIAACETSVREAQEVVATKLQALCEARERKEAAEKAAAMGGQPEAPNTPKPAVLMLDRLKHNLARFADLQCDGRYAMQFLCFVPELRAIVATDGRRIALASIDEGQCSSPLMFDAKEFDGFCRSLGNTDVAIELTVGENSNHVHAGRFGLDLEKKEGRFPKVTDYYHEKKGIEVAFDASYLRDICVHAISLDVKAKLRCWIQEGPDEPSRFEAYSDEDAALGVTYIQMPVRIGG